MGELGFGACLADDMGLGKTVQVLAYLERLRSEQPDAHCLLVIPASLLGNWQKEAEKFAPELPLEILPDCPALEIDRDLQSRSPEALPFLMITTYGMLVRIDAFEKLHFRCLILDEAQAIKNPGAKQTRAVKRLHADMRIAMTGTPIENDLSNLWSLFDFLNQGLMGTAGEFKSFTKELDTHPENYEKLRMMVAPFMLRRLKTDKSIIRDLPEKIEMLDYVSLSRKQVVLYRKREISFRCSCPDWAQMCKHVAAALYGVGVRFDEDPLLFFRLRGIDINRFVDITLATKVDTMLAKASSATTASHRILGSDSDLSKLFGVL